jgi:hypothetical protein
VVRQAPGRGHCGYLTTMHHRQVQRPGVSTAGLVAAHRATNGIV